MIKSISPDIVHILSPHPWNVIYLKMLNPSNTIITLHDPVPHEGESITKFIQYYNSGVKSLSKNIILHSNIYKNKIENEKNKIKVVNLAIRDSSNFDYVLPPKPSVLFFGRIRPYKGIKCYIDACKIVHKHMSDVEFYICGEGDLSEYQQDLLEIPNFIIHNYEIPDDELESVFKRVSFVVLPYITATQSGVIPLAYSFGRTVIATNVGGIPEVVENNKTGYLIEPENPHRLAESIIKLLQNQETLIELSTNAYKKSQSVYSVNNMVKEITEFYKELV